MSERLGWAPPPVIVSAVVPDHRFTPRPSLAGGHRMTLYSWANPRYFPGLPPSVAPLLRRRRRFPRRGGLPLAAAPWGHPTLIALHGLNGSSDAHYMLGLAAKAFSRGLNVVRLNQRNCGGTERLSAGLFHSGLTADAAHVVHELSAVDGLPGIVVAGYSLGGNLALKLAAEYGAHAPATLRAVAAVSPIIEIGECVRALERPGNAVYQWNFVRDLKRRMRRKERVAPRPVQSGAAAVGANRPRVRRGLHRPVLRLPRRRRLLPSRQFAPHHRSYCSAHAGDHRRGRPFCSVAALSRSKAPRQSAHRSSRLRARRALRFRRPRLGPGDDGYWAETQIVELVVRYAGSGRANLSAGGPRPGGSRARLA